MFWSLESSKSILSRLSRALFLTPCNLLSVGEGSPTTASVRESARVSCTTSNPSLVEQQPGPAPVSSSPWHTHASTRTQAPECSTSCYFVNRKFELDRVQPFGIHLTYSERKCVNWKGWNQFRFSRPKTLLTYDQWSIHMERVFWWKETSFRHIFWREVLVLEYIGICLYREQKIPIFETDILGILINYSRNHSVSGLTLR